MTRGPVALLTKLSADFLYNKKVMGKLAVRKTFQALGEFGPAFFLFLIGLLEPPTALSVIFMVIVALMPTLGTNLKLVDCCSHDGWMANGRSECQSH